MMKTKERKKKTRYGPSSYLCVLSVLSASSALKGN